MRFLIPFILFCIVFCDSSCRDNNHSNGLQKSMSIGKLKKIEKETGLTFSKNSRLVNFVQPDVAVDPVWVAQVVMPASSYKGAALL